MTKIAIAFVLTLVGHSVALHAQSRSPDGLMADLIAEVTEVETKVVGLAKVIPESAYDWRPSDGVRSTSEVFRHVAAENYFAAARFGGTAAPADTNIVGKQHKEVAAYETRSLTRAQVIAAVEGSFALLKKSMADTPYDRLDAMTDYSREKVRLRTAWVRTTTHLHEHLGQLIAYTRSNKVVPPWSR